MILTIKNYGIIEELELDLEPGLTTLVGPNGSGKSTSVDALFFVLTGETMDGRNLDERINWGAIPQIAEVKLTCDEFTLTRTIKPTTTSHLLVGPDLKLTKKSEINDYIFRLWNIQSVNQLKDVFFAAQLKATELFDATDAVRLGMLSKLFGFDRLEKGRTAIYNVLSSTAIPTVNEERILQLEDELAVLIDQTTKAGDDFEKAEAAVAEINFDKEEYDRVMAAPLDSQRVLLEKEQLAPINE